jgi:hypothetical protein
MREDYLAFQRGLMFAVCSIRQATVNVPEQIDALFDGGEYDEFPLFGFKWDSWAFVQSELCRELWAEVRAERDPELLILAISRIPGLGIVKSAFVAQLLGADIACIDSRNAKRLSIGPETYKTYGEKYKKTRAFRRRVARYVSDWKGKAAELWDDWCRDIAPRYGMEPDDVSALHLAILPPEYTPF